MRFLRQSSSGMAQEWGARAEATVGLLAQTLQISYVGILFSKRVFLCSLGLVNTYKGPDKAGWIHPRLPGFEY